MADTALSTLSIEEALGPLTTGLGQAVETVTAMVGGAITDATHLPGALMIDFQNTVTAAQNVAANPGSLIPSGGLLEGPGISVGGMTLSPIILLGLAGAAIFMMRKKG